MLMSRTAGHQVQVLVLRNLRKRFNIRRFLCVLNRHQCGLFPNVIQDWNNWLLRMIHIFIYHMPKRVYFLAFVDLLGEHVCIRFTTVIKEYAFPLE